MGPVIAFLFMYRGRRRRAVVPNLGMWAGLEGPASVARRRIREYLPLALFLASLAAAALAAADPQTPFHAPVPALHVLVVDVSPSMNAANPGGLSRMDEANAVLESIASRLPPGSRAVVLTSALRFAGEFTSMPEAAPRIPPRLRARADGGRLDAAVEFGLSALGGTAGKVVCISDRRPAGLGDGRLHWIPVGEDAENAGFVGVSAHDAPRWEPVLAVTCEVANFGRKARLIPLAAAGIEKGLLPPPALVPAGGSMTIPLRIPRARDDSVISVSIGAGDALPDDDSVLISVPGGGPLRIAVVPDGDPDPFIVSAIQSMPWFVDAQASGIAPASAPEGALDGADAVVYCRTGPGRAARGGMIFFGRPPEWIECGPGRISGPAEKSNPFHPVTRGLGFGGVFFRSAFNIKSGVPLIETRDGAVAAAVEIPGCRAVVFGFSTDETNLPLDAVFPLLLGNAAKWAAERNSGTAPRNLSAAEFARDRGSEDAPKTPFYLKDARGGPACVNLADRAESDLRVGERPTRAPFEPAGAAQVAMKSLFPLFGLAALAAISCLMLLIAFRRG